MNYGCCVPFYVFKIGILSCVKITNFIKESFMAKGE